MNGKNKYLKRFLALVLSVAMVVTYMPASLIAYAAEGDEQPAATETVDQQQTTEPQPGDNDKTEVKGEAPAETPAEEPAEPSDDTSKAKSQEKADAGEDVKTEEQTQAPEEQAQTPEEQPVDEQNEEEEEIFPAQDFEGTASSVSVKVHAPEGALPDGTTMEVKGVGVYKMAQVKSAVKDEMGERAKVVKAVDISFYDKDGKEVQPKQPVSVVFDSSKFDDMAKPAVVHIDDKNRADELKKSDVTAEGSEVSFDAEKFSIYAVVDQGEDARMLVKFVGLDGEIASMYVKEGDNMEQVLYDPGAGTLPDGVYFRGWTTNENYTADTNALSIQDVRTEVSGQLPPASDGDTVTYYAMLFKDYRITYLDENDISLGQEEVTFRADSDRTDQAYVVNMGYTVQDDTHHFEGWNVVEGGNNIDGYTEGTKYGNNQQITISGDVTFGVNAPEGHWFIFDENGKGATYNAPQFVYSSDRPQKPEDGTMIRNGYTFGGWFADKATADQTSGGTQYDFNQKLTDKTTVYARWIPNTKANYTIIIWKQNLAADGYDFEEAIHLEGNVGQTINTVTQRGTGDNAYARINGVDKQYTGFHLKEFDQNVEIKTEGNSVLNVYYDRNEYTLTFQDLGYTYTESDSNRDGWYYIPLAEGGYESVYLDHHNGGGGYWQIYDSSQYYDGAIYNGRKYTRSNNPRWTTVKEIKKLYQQPIADNFPIVGTNGITYDNGERWMPQNSQLFDNVIVLLDIMPAENVTFHVDRNDRTTRTMRYYVEALPGETADITYGGKSFKLYNTVYANLGYIDRNLDWLDLSGYTKFGSDPSNWNSQGRLDVNSISFFYTRNAYTINFMDGVYVDGDGNPLEEAGVGQISTETGISYGADVSSHNTFKPDAAHTPSGYVFEGWYIDSACTHPYIFDKMPEGGITVYAKWRQKQYRVFLHPNYPEGATGNIDWGTANQALNFRISEGGHVSEPTGRLTGYEFVGWYLDEACTQVFNGEAYTINEKNVTTPYDKTVDMTDTYDNNGNLIDPKSNSDATGYEGGDRFWITKKLDVYAKWRSTLDGASGIVVEYDANGGTNAPTDTHTYVDDAMAPAGAASKAPAGSHKVFGYWVVQDGHSGEWVDTDTKVFPGRTFKVEADLAKVTEIENPQPGGDTKKYTIRLKAVYIDSEQPTPTHISWFKNDGTAAYATDENAVINVGVNIHEAPTRDGYTFLGWARVPTSTSTDYDEAGRQALAWEAASANWTQDLDESDLYLTYHKAEGDTAAHYTIASGKTVTQVAPDENLPYHAMFAVWEEADVTINYAVAEDSTGKGTVAPASETIKASSGTAAGSTATPSSSQYVLDYWTCDDGTEHISTDAHFTPSKNSDGVYEAHTYYAHFKLAEATVTVHHYLKGTTTKVAEDDTASVTIGTEYTAVPKTTYESRNLTVDNYDPSQKIIVKVKEADTDNVITIYYTLPLKITANSNSKAYDGTALTDSGYTVQEGQLLDDDSVSSVTVTGSQTLVGSSDNTPSAAKVVTGKTEESEGTEVSYYAINYVTGTLTVTDVNVDPSLVVKKSHTAKEGTDTYKEGETVTFNIEVKNIYATAKTITLSEIEGVTLAQHVFNNVAAGETVRTTATYTIKPADVAAGSFTNTVTATLEDKTYTATDTVNTEKMEPALTVEKTASPKDNVKVGDVVAYTVKVTNSGNVTVTGIELSDALMPEASKPAAFDLAPEGVKTVTYNHTVTQADVDAGKIVNTATATGKDPNNADVTDSATATVTTVDAEAALTVDKTANPTSGVEVGQTVTYTVKVTNNGNVTVKDIVLSDSLITLTDAQKNVGTLAPGKDKTITYTYTVTQADVDAGQIDNTATAKGKDPKNADVTDTATATVTTVAANAKLTVEKTANPTSGVSVGSQITYTVKVTNSGNVTVTGIDLADALMPADSKPAAFDLAPEGEKTVTYTYTVTQDDVDAGKVDNTATATGKDPKDAEVKASATATVKTVDSKAQLTVEKTADPTKDVKVNDTVTYTVKVTNSGNVTVKDIVLSDTLVELTDAQKNVGTLAPGADKTITYTYTVTQANVDAGKISNTATATGKDPKDVKVASSDNAEVTTVEAKPELRVQKTGSPASGVKVNDTVTYTVTVTNIGNVTVNNIVLGDTLVELTDEQKAVGTLAPKASTEITYTYKVTQADVDAGEFDNTATATGKDPSNKDVTANATAKVKTVAADAKLTVEKTADKTKDVKVGDTVTYTVKVTNSGNVTVKGITLSDTLVTLTGENAQAFDLTPGKNKTITYTYTVTQANVDAGKIDNTATATGKDPKGAEVKASDDATVTTVAADPKLTVEKTANPASGVNAGEEVTYTVKVTNSGNVTVKGITLSDTLVTMTGDNAKAFDLAPTESKVITYTYKVTQANVDAGKINNTATATGKDPSNKDVTASASKEVTTAAASSELAVTKTASPTSGVKVGATVTYTVKVKNNGNVTVKSGTLADDHVDLSDKTFELAPGEETDPITYTYTVTQADVDAGTFTNTVKANATAARGDNPAEVSAQATVTTVAPEASISVTKSASKTQSIKVDDEIIYTVVVTNTGNVSVNSGTLDDDHADLSAETFELAPGASKTVTYTYKVTQDDIDAGRVTNTVKANAKAARGEDPAEATATSTATADESGAALEITKEADPASGVGVGSKVSYTIKVKNAGDVTVNNVAVTDQLEGIQLGNPDKTTLKPGEEATVTGTYTVTQADVDAGSIVNTATASAKAVRGDDPEDVTDTATVTTVAPDAKIKVTKDADDTIKQKVLGVNAGETITYTVVVENTGNVSVTNGTFDDTLVSLAGKTFSLAPGAKETITYEYTVTQADIDSTAGKITNTVTATADAARVETPVRASDNEEVKTAAQDPKLTVKKTADPTSGVKAGGTVNYKVVVSNSGNVTIKGINVNDPLMPGAKKPAAFDLAPGESREITYTYTVTQADVDAGKIENTATATGKDPKDEDITASDKATVTTEDAAAKISISKTANQEAGYKAGDEISYTVVVSNTGNVTVNNVTVTDDHVQLSETPFELVPGASKTITYKYKATQADFDNGSITNIASATAKAVRGSDPAKVTDDATVQAVAAQAAIKVTKTADPVSGVEVGDTVTYSVVVENTGDVSVKNGTLSDDHADLSGKTFSLAPGAKTDPITYTYKVKQADVDAGQIVNTVTAGAKAARGDDPANVTDSATVTTVEKNAHLTVTKTSDVEEGKTASLGQTITYTINVKNDGNVTISSIGATDTVEGLRAENVKLDKTTLAPGETANGVFWHVVTEKDILAGQVVNTATATGKDPQNKDPEVVDGKKTDKTDDKKPSLKVVKTTTSSPANGTGYALGETIRYNITVTNNGNVTITDAEIEDKLDGFAFDDPSEAKNIVLAPGKSKSITGSYKVTEADIIKGSVVNEATAKGKDPEDEEPKVDPGKKEDPTDTQKPAVTVTKTVNRTSGLNEGDRINYSINVRNTGNVTLTKVDINDTLVNLVVDEFTLQPGEGKTFNYPYTVTAANVTAGRVVNTATATGTAPNGTKPTGRDSVTARTAPAPTPTPGGGGGNPGGGAPAAGPAAPVVPVPAAIDDEPVPQVEPEVIDDDPAPLTPPEGTWALLNLIAAALTTIGAVIALFRKKEDDDEDENETAKKPEDEDEDDNRGRNMMIAKVLGAVAAAASVITFILTEDMSLPMAMTDKWTLLMGVLFAVQIAAAVACKKAAEADEEEEEEGAEA